MIGGRKPFAATLGFRGLIIGLDAAIPALHPTYRRYSFLHRGVEGVT
jgi:hypothetical protein